MTAKKGNERNARAYIFIPETVICLLRSKMMGLESLQLFINFSNISGLFPFRLVVDEQTGRFKRLVGHWRHPANWWFTLLLIGQVYNIILITFVTWITQRNRSLSYVYFLSIGLNPGNYLNTILIPRLFLFRIRHLEDAIGHLVSIDRILTRIIPMPLSCNSRQRTLAGFSVSLFFMVNTIQHNFNNRQIHSSV